MQDHYTLRFRQALLDAAQTRNIDTIDSIINKIYEDGFHDGVQSTDEDDTN